MSSKPDPHEQGHLFGFAQGAFADITRVVDWRELEGRQLESANPIPTVADLAVRQLVELGTDSNRDRWLRKFKGKQRWIPFYEQEVTIGLRTLPIEIEIVAESPGSATNAAVGVLESVDKYISGASVAGSILGSVKRPTDTEPRSPEDIRSSLTVKTAVVEFILAMNSFDLFDWFPRKQSPTDVNTNYDNLVRKAVDELGNPAIVDDKVLILAWKKAIVSQARRHRYWQNQVTNLNHYEFENPNTRVTLSKAIVRYDELRKQKQLDRERILAELGRAAA